MEDCNFLLFTKELHNHAANLIVAVELTQFYGSRSFFFPFGLIIIYDVFIMYSEHCSISEN